MSGPQPTPIKPVEIFQAWKNVLTGDDAVKALAKQRVDTCNECPFKKEIMGVPVCGACGCPLLGKTHSPVNSCPNKKWDV